MASLHATLNQNLAAMMDMHARCKHAHWNVTGTNFIGVHKLFDKFADDVMDWADMLGEQVRFMDREAYGLVSDAAKSFLKGDMPGVVDSKDHLTAIIRDLKKLNTEARLAIKEALAAGDQTTADIYIEITRGLAKDIYLAQSHLTRRS